MLARRSVLLALVLAACSRAPTAPSAEVEAQPAITPLPLYPEAASVRLFVKADGFQLDAQPDIAALTNRCASVELTPAEQAIVKNAVSIGPMPDEVTACAPTWRHLFVFYGASDEPMGALAVCFECLEISVLGPAAPNPTVYSAQYRVTGLRELVEARGLLTEADRVQ